MKVLGLDVGTKRVGVAVADSVIRIANPLCTLDNNDTIFSEIARIAREQNTSFFVVGLPRNNSGAETRQTEYCRQFANAMTKVIPGAKIRFQDESLTSIEAENRLKARKKNYVKGDIDAEAAAIILQDFVEGFSGQSQATPVEGVSSNAATQQSEETVGIEEIPALNKHKGSVLKRLVVVLVVILVACGAGYFGFNIYYKSALKPISDVSCASEPTHADCQPISFTVTEGESLQNVADNLQSAGLIRSSLVFQLYAHTNNYANQIKASDYDLYKTMSVYDLLQQLIAGDKNSNVFTITILPGSTVYEVKQQLVSLGYTQEEVDAAFTKDYDHPVLAGRPATNEFGAEPLEGYIFGDTYEFYKGESVEKIITTTLDALNEVVTGNNLVAKFEEHGLSLYQGITLASIVQREAPASQGDKEKIAQVFYSRLSQNIMLGSDVTTAYALDLVDRERATYTDNTAALSIDSPYNTRNHLGLTPGPISNPGIAALLAVANPSDTSYLYFLTGDDGTMYYSYTEDEHNQNIYDHCQVLCGVSL